MPPRRRGTARRSVSRNSAGTVLPAPSRVPASNGAGPRGLPDSRVTGEHELASAPRRRLEIRIVGRENLRRPGGQNRLVERMMMARTMCFRHGALPPARPTIALCAPCRCES